MWAFDIFMNSSINFLLNLWDYYSFSLSFYFYNIWLFLWFILNLIYSFLWRFLWHCWFLKCSFWFILRKAGHNFCYLFRQNLRIIALGFLKVAFIEIIFVWYLDNDFRLFFLAQVILHVALKGLVTINFYPLAITSIKVIEGGFFRKARISFPYECHELSICLDIRYLDFFICFSQLDLHAIHSAQISIDYNFNNNNRL